MALRRGFYLPAGLLSMVAAAGILACGGDSVLDLLPTPTTEPTAVAAEPTQPAAQPTAAPAATEVPLPGGAQEYTVQPGDTLSGIAEQFGVSLDALIQENSIADPNLIVPGETLIIPAPQ